MRLINWSVITFRFEIAEYCFRFMLPVSSRQSPILQTRVLAKPVRIEFFFTLFKFPLQWAVCFLSLNFLCFIRFPEYLLVNFSFYPIFLCLYRSSVAIDRCVLIILHLPAYRSAFPTEGDKIASCYDILLSFPLLCVMSDPRFDLLRSVYFREYKLIEELPFDLSSQYRHSVKEYCFRVIAMKSSLSGIT